VIGQMSYYPMVENLASNISPRAGTSRLGATGSRSGTGHYGVGVLLESCLADKLAFVERTRRLIRNVFEVKMAKKIAERLAA